MLSITLSDISELAAKEQGGGLQCGVPASPQGRYRNVAYMECFNFKLFFFIHVVRTYI